MEQRISYQTAKLAKSKGYPGEIGWGYSKGVTVNNKPGLIRGMSDYPAPTQTILSKWLREEHDIHVDIVLNKLLGTSYREEVFFPMVNAAVKYGMLKESYHKEYEQAFEIGLAKALALL